MNHWCYNYKKRKEVIKIATNKPRYSITVDEKLFEEIENFRFDNRFATRNQATVELIKKGLDSIKNQNSNK